MDLDELVNSGRVPIAPLVKDLAQKVFLIEAKLDVLIGLQIQTVAALENREFEEVAANVKINFEKQAELAHKQFLDMLASNTM